MMTKNFKKLSILCAALVMFACSGDNLYEDLNVSILQEEVFVNNDVCMFVSSEQASNVAQSFLSRHTDTTIGTRMTDSEAVITTVDKNGDPQMYILNYPGGGWAIVSATREYYPILAFSDEGSFDISSDLGSALLWLEETKEAIEMSGELDEKVRAKVRMAWNSYEPVEFQLSQESTTGWTQNPMQEAYEARINEMIMSNVMPGWTQISSLASAHLFVNEDDLFRTKFTAHMNGSPPEYTIIFMRREYISNWIGPWAPNWHQHTPFNNLAPSRHPAGCAAIAMAQIMGFHRFPHNLSWNNFHFNWNNIHNVVPSSSSAHASLIRLTGSAVNMNYMSGGSWALPGNVVSGFRFFGYNVRRANHNLFELRNEIFNQRRPVMMIGGSLPLPSPIGLINGHYWVCDGGIQSFYRTSFIVEFINPHTLIYSNLGFSSTSNPQMGTSNFFELYHMNWGWQNTQHNGYFLWNTFDRPGNHNFSRHRENFYAHPF
jgi:hypothetical protein